MTDQELKQLAQTITEALADDCHLPLCMVNETEEVKSIPKFLKLLLRTHCIVSKELILSQHAWYMQRMKEVSSARQTNSAKAIALEAAFGTELFEERSEK